MQHVTVLLQEAVDSLNLSKNDTILDATFGAGGHATEILKRLGEQGTFIGIDVDKKALAKELDNPHQCTVHLINDNFRNIKDIVTSLSLTEIDGVLADLGWRMEQFSGTGSGLSFQHDEPLHMTYGDKEEYSFTAEDILNEWDESTIADIIYGYGEDRFARRIAKEIVETRKESPFKTTFDLRDAVQRAVPQKAQRGKVHPATKTFQALRIAVNEELTSLEKFIDDAFDLLASEGRMVIISFHSLEDRIVKQSFKKLAAEGKAALINKKPIIPSEEELLANPRSRSSKLRVIEKI